MKLLRNDYQMVEILFPNIYCQQKSVTNFAEWEELFFENPIMRWSKSVYLYVSRA